MLFARVVAVAKFADRVVPLVYLYKKPHVAMVRYRPISAPFLSAGVELCLQAREKGTSALAVELDLYVEGGVLRG